MGRFNGSKRVNTGGSFNVSDATITVSDVALGKIGYGSGGKLTGLAKGFTLVNLIENGDFSGGATSWKGTNSTRNVVNEIMEATMSARYGSVHQLVNVINTHIYYWGCFARGNVDHYCGYLGGQTFTLTDELIHRSRLITASASESWGFGIGDGRSSGFTKCYLDNCVLCDLTASFGAGNEPSLTQMDVLLQKLYPSTRFFSGTKTIIDSL